MLSFFAPRRSDKTATAPRLKLLFLASTAIAARNSCTTETTDVDAYSAFSHRARLSLLAGTAITSVCLVAVEPAAAAPLDFVGTQSADWFTAANWSPASVPNIQNGDIATISNNCGVPGEPSPCAATITITSPPTPQLPAIPPASADTVIIRNGATLTATLINGPPGTILLRANTIVIGNPPNQTPAASAGTFPNPLNFTDLPNLVFNYSNSANTTFSSSLAGATTVSHFAGTTTLGGNNTYTGDTLILGGTVLAGAANALSPSSAFTVAAGGTLVNGGFNSTIGSLTGAGQVFLGSQLSVGGNNSSTTFSGVLSDTPQGSIPGTLTKIGSGTLVLTNTNTYSGGTQLNAGTVSVSADANLGAASGGLTL